MLARLANKSPTAPEDEGIIAPKLKQLCGRRQRDVPTRAMFGTEVNPPAWSIKRAGGPVGGKAGHRRAMRFHNSEQMGQSQR